MVSALRIALQGSFKARGISEGSPINWAQIVQFAESNLTEFECEVLEDGLHWIHMHNAMVGSAPITTCSFAPVNFSVFLRLFAHGRTARSFKQAQQWRQLKQVRRPQPLQLTRKIKWKHNRSCLERPIWAMLIHVVACSWAPV